LSSDATTLSNFAQGAAGIGENSGCPAKQMPLSRDGGLPVELVEN
jgi:hypothetical protein